MLVGFEPIIAKDPKVLILGSMPSVTSLQLQEYYGYRHNRFWKIMCQCFAMPINTYEEKKQIIYRNHLILWDVIHSCEREGSLDSKIRNETVNPIDQLAARYPTLHTVICNGKKSETLYLRYFSDLDLTLHSLPSTSNANRTIKEDVLFERWISVLQDSLKKE